MGLLKITGTIDIGQFWPRGSSDADTVGVQVTLADNPFKFRKNPGGKYKVTHAFDQALVKGVGGKKYDPISSDGRIKIRLQGIDAPELHYHLSTKPKNMTPEQEAKFKALNAKEYRQFFGESAAVAAGELLAQTGQSVIPCTVTTEVDLPNEVCDAYGRFVGDVVVKVKSKNVNLNRWTIEQGWAFPTFYSSMSVELIKTLLVAAQKGSAKQSRPIKFLQKTMGTLDESLVFRKGSSVTPDPASDTGPVLMPKLFRRLTEWTILNKSGVTADSFHQFLTKKKDSCFTLSDFLMQGTNSAPIRFLNEFVDPDGKINFNPSEIVFRELPSLLLGPDGQPVTQW
ncbi:MAG TPA: thermonuclease family protein [Blastocatellia bacterium]|nr:thermonuclease family protein [Blastocatellia bacterium]